MKYKKPLHTQFQAGFTLVELMVAMALMAAFLVVLTDVVSVTADVQSESAATSAVSEDSRFILARLDYDLQRASAITTPNTLGGSTNSLALTINGTTYTYALTDGSLQLNNGTSIVALNSSGTVISNLTFQRLGSTGYDTIRATFTVTSTTTTDQGTETRTTTTTLGRRQ